MATGDTPCEGVTLPLAVRVELDVAAGEPLGDRLEVADGEAGATALDDDDCVADWEAEAVGVNPLVTVCVADRVCDGVADPDGDNNRLAA